MNIKDFSESLPYLFEAQITAFVWGNSGIGKSSIIKQYAESKGYFFFPLYLGTQSDLGDVLGLADFIRDKDGTAIATTFATPIWLKNAIKHCEDNPDSGAIIFLDEFNRARRDVLNGMFSLALDKTFHTIKLPKNCYIIAAGNPPTDEYFVTDVNETALMARFAHIKLEPSVDEWIQYALGKEVNPDLVSFIRNQPDLLEDAKSSFTLPVKVDRRSYERLDRLYKVNTPQHLLSQLMAGIIGIERTVAFQEHLKKTEKPLSGEEILAGSERLPDMLKVGDIKSSMISISCDNLIDLIKLKENEADESKRENVFSEDDIKNIGKFLLEIPKENAYIFLCKAIKDFNLISLRPLYKDKTFGPALVEIKKAAKGEINE